MARAVGNQNLFVGQVMLVSVDDLDAFVRRATAEESFTYCEAPDLIRSPTSARVTELSTDGLVRPHRKRRAGGGWCFYVVRTAKRGTSAQSPVEAALSDAATDIIFRELKRAANFDLPCPSDADLARKAGLTSRDQAQWRVRKLVHVQLVSSELAYEGGVPTRVVTIVATGKRTRLPAKWQALQQAAAADQAMRGDRR